MSENETNRVANTQAEAERQAEARTLADAESAEAEVRLAKDYAAVGDHKGAQQAAKNAEAFAEDARGTVVGILGLAAYQTTVRTMIAARKARDVAKSLGGPPPYLVRMPPQVMGAVADIIRENLVRACAEESGESPAAGSASIANQWLRKCLEPVMRQYEDNRRVAHQATGGGM